MTLLDQLSGSLLKSDQDFSTAFMVINGIKDVLRDDRSAPLENVFRVCERILASPAYREQKQAYFLYRSVAETLQGMALRPGPEEAAGRGQALDLLLSAMGQPHESLRRAAAEALGTLPLAIDRRPPPDPAGAVLPPGALPACDSAWLAGHNIHPLDGWRWQGRSLLAQTRSGELLVVKCLRKGEDPVTLCREAAWMDYLEDLSKPMARPFHVPRPLRHGKGYLVRAPHGSRRPPGGTELHPRRYAMAFRAWPDYFHYPNEASPERRLSGGGMCAVLGRNAWLMGRLMAMGIAHTAPIPLFHNRAQRHRREDAGRYRWTHRGRLDRWLASCRHPNFGVSGLRDFEHFSPAAGRPLVRYEVIGSHLISLLLVAGSYFRQKAPERTGFDVAGQPVDARDLFDRDVLQAAINQIWKAYAEGFTGEAPADSAAVIPASLPDRMIDEMGVDRHMEEILRVVDQEAMSGAMFVSFLQSRGVPTREALRMPKGQADIPLMTGPHLGGFNQPISLPELIDFAAAGAAHCVAASFRKERVRGKA